MKAFIVISTMLISFTTFAVRDIDRNCSSFQRREIVSVHENLTDFLYVALLARAIDDKAYDEELGTIAYTISSNESCGERILQLMRQMTYLDTEVY